MGDPRQTSGEFQAVLLNVLNDVKTDGRENRQKLETVLIRLAEGDGRMERIELQGKTSREHLADIKIQLTNFDTRLTALERGTSSGFQRAIKTAVEDLAPQEPPHLAHREVATERKPKAGDGWISTSALLKVAGLLAGLLTTVVTCYFAFRQTEVEAKVEAERHEAAPAVDASTHHHHKNTADETP